MRVGIDIRELEKNKRTGIGRYLLNFLTYVSENDRENEYILFGDQDTSYSQAGFNIRLKILNEFYRPYWDQVTLLKEISREKIDLFFSPNHKSPVFSPVKKIVTVHDIYPFSIRQFQHSLVTLARRQHYKIMFYSADLIIVVSEYIKQSILETVKLNPDRVKVVYNSVGEEFRVLERNTCKDKVGQLYGIKKDFILYVGNLKPHKNLTTLLHAYSLLKQDFRNRYQLVIVAGEDSFYANFQKTVKELNLEKDILFLDSVKDNDLVLLYNAASLFISVSLYEGFGLPFIEAMACGVPVVASNISAVPEIVQDAAVLVDPLDAQMVSREIVRVLESEALKGELVKKGLIRIEKFSPRTQGESTLKLFKLV